MPNLKLLKAECSRKLDPVYARMDPAIAELRKETRKILNGGNRHD